MGSHFRRYTKTKNAWTADEARYYPRLNVGTIAPSPGRTQSLTPPNSDNSPRGTVILINPGKCPPNSAFSGGWLYRAMPGKTLLVVGQIVDLSVESALLRGKTWANDDYVLVLNLFDACGGSPGKIQAVPSKLKQGNFGAFIWLAWGDPKKLPTSSVPMTAINALNPFLGNTVAATKNGVLNGGPVTKITNSRLYHPNGTGYNKAPVVEDLIDAIVQKL